MHRLPFIRFNFGTLIDDLFKAVVGNNLPLHVWRKESGAEPDLLEE